MSQGGKKFWALMMDKKSKMMWSFFLKWKSNLADAVVLHFQEMKAKDGKSVKFI